METLQEYLQKQGDSTSRIAYGGIAEAGHHNFFVYSNADDDPKRFIVVENVVFPEIEKGVYFKRLSFSQALTLLRRGERMSREQWAKSWIQFVPPLKPNDQHVASKIILTSTMGDSSHVWYAGVNDMCTNDWFLIPKGDYVSAN